jgi:hypothetical protein
VIRTLDPNLGKLANQVWLILSDGERPETPPSRHLLTLPCSSRNNAVPVCGATLSRAGVPWGSAPAPAAAHRARVGQPRAFVAPGHDPPALLGSRLQPVEFAQTHPRAFGHEVQAGQRPGDQAAAAGDAVGGVTAQAGQPHGRIGGPDRQEDAAGRSLATAPGQWRLVFLPVPSPPLWP